MRGILRSLSYIVKTYYPAKHYLLVLRSHGNGMAMCPSGKSRETDRLYSAEISHVLSKVKVEFIRFYLLVIRYLLLRGIHFGDIVISCIIMKSQEKKIHMENIVSILMELKKHIVKWKTSSNYWII